MPAAPRPGWGPGPPRRRNEIQPAKFYVRTSSSFVGVFAIFALLRMVLFCDVSFVVGEGLSLACPC